jgi:penicillin-binding protein 1C
VTWSWRFSLRSQPSPTTGEGGASSSNVTGTISSSERHPREGGDSRHVSANAKATEAVAVSSVRSTRGHGSDPIRNGAVSPSLVDIARSDANGPPEFWLRRILPSVDSCRASTATPVSSSGLSRAPKLQQPQPPDVVFAASTTSVATSGTSGPRDKPEDDKVAKPGAHLLRQRLRNSIDFQPSRLAKHTAIAATIIALLTAGGYGALRFAMSQMGDPQLPQASELSTVVLDRHGKLLRAYTTPDGRWRMPVEPDDVDPRYLAILMAFEDQRFYEHPGFEARAFVRAAVTAVTHQRLVSGGSTLTMQVARLLDGRHERTPQGKLRQVVRALQLEERFDKKEILRLYLRLAPFGGNIEGTRAASLAYFGKEPRHLSVGEAALLVALPQSPEVRRPDRGSKYAAIARNRVLDRALEVGVITQAEADRAKTERVPTARRPFPKLAPHLSDSEVAHNPDAHIVRLTLDAGIQGALETLAEDQARLLGPKLSAAILATDHTTGEVLAYVGSAGYLDGTRFGAVDMVQAVRSPGSTLKPVIYGLAFESGLAHPETFIEDKRTRFGSYSPENFDEDFHGTVTIREALGNSLNVPAVKVLAAVGPNRLVGRLKRAGLEPQMPPMTQPTLAIALGGVGTTLQDLTSLYAGIARGGEAIKLSWRPDEISPAEGAGLRAAAAAKRRVLSPVASWYVTDILKDAPPPANFKRGAIAYKTGTSYGYRDAWAIGYDGRYTIAVWIGRPDGVSTPGLMGRLAAAPILFDAFTRISEHRAAFAPAPPGVLKVSSGAGLPPPLKRFREGPDDVLASAGPFLEPPVLISFPPDRAELERQSEDEQPVVFKAEGGALPLTWLIDGKPIDSNPHRREVSWTPGALGFVKLSVVDAKGRVDRVTVRLKQD